MWLACQYGDRDGCNNAVVLLRGQCDEHNDGTACCMLGNLLLTDNVAIQRNPRLGQQYIRAGKARGGQCRADTSRQSTRHTL
jgi:hypothetical protein